MRERIQQALRELPLSEAEIASITPTLRKRPGIDAGYGVAKG